MNPRKIDALFFQVIMTIVLTVAFLIFGGLMVAGLVWGYSLLGPVVVVIVLLLATVVSFAWVVSGALLKK